MRVRSALQQVSGCAAYSTVGLDHWRSFCQTVHMVGSYTSHVTLKIFDILRRKIVTLVNEEKPIGTYELTWNAEILPSGVYFCKLKLEIILKQRR